MGQHAVHSLALGSIYALLAVGLTFMYAAHRSLYLAYGGLYALGGYVTWWAIRYDYTVWGALGLAIVGCTLAGCLSHGLFRVVRSGASEVSWLLVGLGLLICLQESYRLGIGPYRFKVIAIDSHQIHNIGPLMLTDVHWFVFGGAFALFTIIQGFLSTSQFGRTLHTFLQEGPVRHSESHTRWLEVFASGLGGALAGVSGVLGVLYLNEVYPDMGTMVTHKILALVLIGVLGNLRGAVLAAFALAFIEGVLLPATNLPIPPEAILLICLALAGVLYPQRIGNGAGLKETGI